MEASKTEPAFSLSDWHEGYELSNLVPSYSNSSLLPVSSLLPASRSSRLESFHLGTGSTIYSTLAPIILANTSRELLITTCFWSSSASARTIALLLRALSRKAREAQRAVDGEPSSGVIRVRICISSLSLWQKLFHTQSPDGYVYPASKWPKALGLPPPAELPGLDIQVKSVFIKPFSVMHPKYIICDRHLAIMPSCNVSWEDWFEGALVVSEDVQWHWLEGVGWQTSNQPGIVTRLVDLWRAFWGRVPANASSNVQSSSQRPWQIPVNDAPFQRQNQLVQIASPAITAPPLHSSAQPLIAADLPSSISLSHSASSFHQPKQTLLLPHPHSSDPLIHLSLSSTFPFLHPYSANPASYPSTPLTEFTLALLNTAQHSITLVTPNLTAAPAIAAIRDALTRGVRVTLVTNDALMRAEQWATACTTTTRQVAQLRAWYARSGARGVLHIGWFTALAGDAELAETGPSSPVQSSRRRAATDQNLDIEAALGNVNQHARAHPVKSHLKCTAVDGRLVLLGSGNMDRASWVTSQELGIAVQDADAVRRIMGAVDAALRGRVRWEGDEGFLS